VDSVVLKVDAGMCGIVAVLADVSCSLLLSLWGHWDWQAGRRASISLASGMIAGCAVRLCSALVIVVILFLCYCYYLLHRYSPAAPSPPTYPFAHWQTGSSSVYFLVVYQYELCTHAEFAVFGVLLLLLFAASSFLVIIIFSFWYTILLWGPPIGGLITQCCLSVRLVCTYSSKSEICRKLKFCVQCLHSNCNGPWRL